MVAGQSLHWSSGEALTIQASNAAIASDLRVHAGQAIGWLANAVESKDVGATPALSMVTAEGTLDFQHDVAKLQSRDQLKIVSANAEVELAAGRTIHMATSGGASITIEGGNITIACPDNITVHAAKKSFVGPAQLSREMQTWTNTAFERSFRFIGAGTEEAIPEVAHFLTHRGSKRPQKANGEGLTEPVKDTGPQDASVSVDWAALLKTT